MTHEVTISFTLVLKSGTGLKPYISSQVDVLLQEGAVADCCHTFTAFPAHMEGPAC